MRVTILGKEDSWHVSRLADRCRERGASVTVREYQALTARLRTGAASLQLEEEELAAADRVMARAIPAGSLEQVVFRMNALHRLWQAGIPILNPPTAVEACVDKYLATARLAAAGLPVPRTVVCESLDHALAAFHDLGGDVVVKPLFGSEGRGIHRIDDPAVAYRVFRALRDHALILYLQEFIHHPGHDVRVLVIGGRVIAAMRRNAVNDFRTNVACGGRAERVALPDSWADLAVRASAAVGALLCGVDLLAGVNGAPVVLEVNSAPGFLALTEATGMDIADQIAAYFLSDAFAEACAAAQAPAPKGRLTRSAAVIDEIGANRPSRKE